MTLRDGWSFALCALLSPLLGAAPAAAQVAAPTSAGGPIIVLVRHGETTPDGSRDPALSEAGRARAERLGRLLRDAGLDRVLTSPYRRTRSMALVVAESAGVAVEEYDPLALDALAERLLGLGSDGAVGGEGRRRVLVVGHSNTTPELVARLGGDAGGPIAEDEHDRVYLVFDAGAGVETVLLRY